MKSHLYLCTPRQLAKIILPTLGIVVITAALLNWAQHSRILPPAPATEDPDSTVLLHQARALRVPDPASLLLIGDSTCLVGVDAPDLSRRLPGNPKVLSLALFIWIDLKIYGEEVERFAAAHPGQVQDVVLLVTPPKLSGQTGDNTATRMWQQAVSAKYDYPPTADAGRDLLGGQIFRHHILAHVLDSPLHGTGAEFFGFSSEIDKYLTEHHGSLISFGTVATPRGAARPDWKLAPELEPESRAFRAKLPPNVKLFIGLTPGPEGTCPPNNSTSRATMLEGWNKWVQADALLTNLPSSLPDVFFSGGGHLNALGQKRFTAALASSLAPLLDRGREQRSPVAGL